MCVYLKTKLSKMCMETKAKRSPDSLSEDQGWKISEWISRYIINQRLLKQYGIGRMKEETKETLEALQRS